jgi:hypothetical protein
MMITQYLAELRETIRPEQLDMLQRVFDRACVSGHLGKQSPQAEGMAATLFRLFKSGIEDEETLLEMLAQIEFL